LLLGILDEVLRGTVQVVLPRTAERGHAVLTSDGAAIAAVNPDLVLVHV